MSKEWFEGLTCEDARAERCRLRKFVFFALGLVALGLLLVATRAYANDVPLHYLEQRGVEIRLMSGPCVDEVSIRLIRPDQVSRFRAIQSVWPERDGTRKTYAGCWAELTPAEARNVEGGFLVVFSDGESGFIPKSEFKRKPSA